MVGRDAVIYDLVTCKGGVSVEYLDKEDKETDQHSWYGLWELQLTLEGAVCPSITFQ